MLKEFKDFVSRGNLVEIAVGLVMALAFKAVVDALVAGLIMPIIGAIFGEPSFDNLTFTINDSVFLYGTFITQAVTFVLIALALFFFVVKPFNAWQARKASGEEEAPAALPEDVALLREIRDALQR
jgi:large conductance mechanosensitive channel